MFFVFQYVWCWPQRLHWAVGDDEVGQVNLPDDEPDQRQPSAFKPRREGQDHLQDHGQGRRRSGQQGGVHLHLLSRTQDIESAHTPWNVRRTSFKVEEKCRVCVRYCNIQWDEEEKTSHRNVFTILLFIFITENWDTLICYVFTIFTWPSQSCAFLWKCNKRLEIILQVEHLTIFPQSRTALSDLEIQRSTKCQCCHVNMKVASSLSSLCRSFPFIFLLMCFLFRDRGEKNNR